MNKQRVGLMATGSELVYGEILNTNGQRMAQQMQDVGIEVGEHIIVTDAMESLTSSLKFLLENHDAVITSGGLGPTCDDITRDAIAQVLGIELEYQQASFDRIVERFSKRGIDIPDSNKRQAYFPKEAIIYANDNGTADGCLIEHDGKCIFMLPGPPRECLPIFEQKVLPTLREKGFASAKRLYRWRLMGISESQCAQQIEAKCTEFNLDFGYRAHYPYLDIKLTLNESDDIERITDIIYQHVKPYLVTTENVHVSTMLQHALLHYPVHLTICDQATKDAFKSELVTAENHQKLNFVVDVDELGDQHAVHIKGLETFWNPEPECYVTNVQVELIHQGEKQSFNQDIYLRGAESIRYAVEFVSHKIYQAWFQT